tara:strand:+ start:91 stop:336 length:246 start_codon:yes stop_codon:yes gene_type:complete
MTHLEELEDTLNIHRYVKRDEDEYRGVRYVIVQNSKQEIKMILADRVYRPTFSSYREADSYIKGYIDGCKEYDTGWTQYSD